MFCLNKTYEGAKEGSGTDSQMKGKCDIEKHSGIKVNFISRWKQCLSKDLSGDL